LRKTTYKFIVLEGIDGATLYRTPPPGFSTTRRIIDDNAQLPSRFLFYMSSVVYASEKIRKLLLKTHVVCDRYLISTLAYHRSLGLKLKLDVDALNLVQPDFTFFLELSDETERQRRLHQRKRYSVTDANLEDKVKRRLLLEEYRRYPMIPVDTTHSTVNETVRTIRTIVGL
jgi:thymidylate kinase